MALMPVEEALQRLLAVAPQIVETRKLAPGEAAGFTLASAAVAVLTQPPFNASAMDGYAVRAADLVPEGSLRVVGESAAGRPSRQRLGAGEAMRIFTGAPVPPGADTVVPQENVVRLDGGYIRLLQTEPRGRHVRALGLDFSAGAELLRAGLRLDSRHIALAATAGITTLEVCRTPRVAILSTGDELVAAGQTPGDGQIVSSNALALAARAREAGAEPIDLGIAPDTLAATVSALERGLAEADLVVTSGGASVGDHDHIRPALERLAFELDFWKIALRPGKPMLLAKRGGKIVLGLPGNPVSSAVCAFLFMLPLLRRMQGGVDADADRTLPAVLGSDLPANDMRQDYLRSGLVRDDGGRLVATPHPIQDSSMQSVLAASDALLIRPPHAPAAARGEPCRIMLL
jgi:molybdopterin molybdotransferase